MKPPTPADIKRVRDRLGITRAEFAGRLNTPPRTLEGWEAGKQAPGCLWAAMRYVEEHIEDPPDV